MLQNLSLRKKLALIALGPLLALLVLSFFRIRAEMDDSSAASDAQSHATISALNGQLFEALRAEAVDHQTIASGGEVDLGPVEARSNEAAESWLQAVAGTPFEGLDGNDGLASFLGDLESHRRTVETSQGPDRVFQLDMDALERVERYDGLLAASAGGDAVDLARAADLTTVAASAAELQLLGILATQADTAPVPLDAAIGSARGAAESFPLRTAVELPVANNSYRTLVDELASLNPGDAVELPDGDWRVASDERANQLAQARVGLVSNASAVAASAQSDAQGAVRNTGLLFLLGTLLAAAATWFVGKGIVRALHGLRDEATNVADSDLPRVATALRSGNPVVGFDDERTIEGVGDDEFGEVATQIRSIRNSAAGLGGQVAELQAGISDTFVNLARRNQALVDRQLEAIDTLEADERDEDRLALMYRVDHLATRMRRNAESLLVLADAKTPERHSPPVELREVLRVAIGEVEDYRRVVPISLDDLLVPGHKAQDLAHLLAELMENATQQSPPGTAVDVSGAFDPSSRDYLISILDHGTGIDPEQLTTLNTLLATPPTSTMTISHSIGLQVVSRLSHALGIDVRLAGAPDGGIIAAVRIPAALAQEWGVPAAVAPAAPVEPAMPVPDVASLAPLSPAEPAIAVPSMDLGGLGDPGGVELPTPAAAPEVEMPALELDLPSFGSTAEEAAPPLADIAAPLPETPDFTIPEVSVPDVGVPDMALPEVAPVDPVMPPVDVPAPAQDPFAASEIPDLAAPVAETPLPPTPEPSLSEPPIVDPFATPVIPDMALEHPAPAEPAAMVDPFAAPDIPDAAVPPTSVDPVFPSPSVEEVPPAASSFPAVVPEAEVVQTPVVEPPVAQPPVAQPPVAQPPVAPVEPPVAQPPVAQPPVAPVEPPVAQPPVAQPPVAQPPVAQPPVAQPPVAQPPVAQPPVAQPPAAPAPAAQAPIPEPGQAAPLPQRQSNLPPAAAAPSPAPTPEVAAGPPTAPLAEPTAPEKTSAGLTRRKRSTAPVETFDVNAERTAPSQRTPDQVKNMLSRYKTGLERGRSSAETDGES